MSLRKFDPTQQLSMKECSKRLDMVMKIYNRFSTPEIEAVLRALYMKKITRELLVNKTDIVVTKESLPVPKRKYTKSKHATHSSEIKTA